MFTLTLGGVLSGHCKALPWPEYEGGKTIVLSLAWFNRANEVESELGWHGEIPVQIEIIKNLPEHASMLAFVKDPVKLEKIQNYISSIRPDIKLRFILDARVGRQDAIWVRDSFPQLIRRAKASVDWSFVTIKNRWELNQSLFSFLTFPFLSSEEKFQFGNILSDDKRCYSFKGRQPYSELQKQLGCEEMVLLQPQRDEPWGIFHIDERLKFLANDLALTDVPSWRENLESLGKNVSILPRPPSDENIPVHPGHKNDSEYLKVRTKFRTYANSIIIGNTAFVPVFGVSTDSTALQIYSEHGFDVVPIDSNLLATSGQGSLHCISATLPDLNIAFER